MTSTVFVNTVTLTDDDWFNDVNRLHYTIFGDPTAVANAQTGLRIGSVGRATNLALAASVGSSALTITLQSNAAGTPSAAEPVRTTHRSATVGTGTFTELDVTGATTLVISSGSTMGARNAIPFRLWIVAFNDAGTFRLGAINCLTTVAGIGAGSDVTKIYPLSAWGIDTSTAEGGAGGADLAQTFYTGTAVTAKAYQVLGYLTWETGLTTAGTWDAVPTRIQTFGPSVPLPGQAIQIQRNDTGAVATGATAIPYDDTIPQITEGDQYMTQAITPTSAANVLAIKSDADIANTNVAQNLTVALFQDATANAIAVKDLFNNVGSADTPFSLNKLILAAGTAATTLRVRAGGTTGATTTFNGAAGARKFGGTINSYMEVQEVMA